MNTTRPQFSHNLEEALTSFFSTKGFSSEFQTKKVFTQSSLNFTASTNDQLSTPVKGTEKSRQIDSLCLDIENMLQQSINFIAENPCFDSSKLRSTMSDETEIKIVDKKVASRPKRIRRKPEELAMNSLCPYFSCDKSYSSKASLKLHIKINHCADDAIKRYDAIPVDNIAIKKGIKLERIFSKAHVDIIESRACVSTTNDTSDKSSQHHSISKTSESSINLIGEEYNNFSEVAYLGKRKACQNIFDQLDRSEKLNTNLQVSNDFDEDSSDFDCFQKIINQFEDNSTRLDSMYDTESYFYSPDCESDYGGKMFDFNEEDALVKQLHLNETTGDIFASEEADNANPDIFQNFNEIQETDDLTDKFSVFSSDDAIERVAEFDCVGSMAGQKMQRFFSFECATNY